MGELVKEYKKGRVRVSIWKNKGRNKEYLSYSIRRVYKAGDGSYRDTNSFSYEDLIDLMFLLDCLVYPTALELYELKREKEEKGGGSSSSVVDYGEVK